MSAIEIIYTVPEGTIPSAVEQVSGWEDAAAEAGKDFHDWAVLVLDGPDMGIQFLRLGQEFEPEDEVAAFIAERVQELARETVDSPSEGAGSFMRTKPRADVAAHMRDSGLDAVADLLDIALPNGYAWLAYVWIPESNSTGQPAKVACIPIRHAQAA